MQRHRVIMAIVDFADLQVVLAEKGWAFECCCFGIAAKKSSNRGHDTNYQIHEGEKWNGKSR